MVRAELEQRDQVSSAFHGPDLQRVPGGAGDHVCRLAEVHDGGAAGYLLRAVRLHGCPAGLTPDAGPEDLTGSEPSVGQERGESGFSQRSLLRSVQHVAEVCVVVVSPGGPVGPPGCRNG